jgi:V/A-type H+/Na+-transporting ATPase subunit K
MRVMRFVRRVAFAGTTAILLAAPQVALAATQVDGKTSAGAYTARYIGAGLAMGLSALGAGYAQGKIGSAGAGTLAERPEAATMILVLEALPEIIALLGFAMAFLMTQPALQ